ncbi:hypothetical protein OIO90_001488 [Microbotryomycetes sp. JL221]|nr:hypothetical protein OIO90_001488 [Microbotryomycetes sp. JL221]
MVSAKPDSKYTNRILPDKVAFMQPRKVARTDKKQFTMWNRVELWAGGMGLAVLEPGGTYQSMPARSTRTCSISSTSDSSLASTTTASTPPSEVVDHMSPWSKPTELVPVPGRRGPSGDHGATMPASSTTASGAVAATGSPATRSVAGSPKSVASSKANKARQEAQSSQHQQHTKTIVWQPKHLAKPPKKLSKFRQWFIFWESTSVLSMLEPWEHMFVYATLLLLFSFAYWAVKNYFPAHVRTIATRVVYYIKGSDSWSSLTASTSRSWSGV